MSETSPVVGGVYASQTADRTYRITKVLVAEDGIVHVRMYAERFAELPKSAASSDLSLGSIGSAAGFGIGHAPMALEGFLAEPRVLLGVEPVDEEELEGYRIWAGDDDA